jgi:reactive intermediate/imine deaminase
VELINPASLSAFVKGYSHGVVAGDFVFVAGQLAFDEEGNLVGEGDIKAQTKRVFENVSAVLEEAGLSLNDAVYVTVYIKDLAHYRDYAEAYQEAFGGHGPARATVQCELVLPEALVEAQVIAYRGG